MNIDQAGFELTFCISLFAIYLREPVIQKKDLN